MLPTLLSCLGSAKQPTEEECKRTNKQISRIQLNTLPYFEHASNLPTVGAWIYTQVASVRVNAKQRNKSLQDKTLLADHLQS